jgi:hypothetical protein
LSLLLHSHSGRAQAETPLMPLSKFVGHLSSRPFCKICSIRDLSFLTGASCRQALRYF